MDRLAMVQRLPSLSWLRAFEAAARHLSFTHAAEELFLTQAAISKQVKLLEQFLREPLFERKPRSLVLTKVGAAYLPKVQDSFERLRAGTQEVFGNRRRELLTLRAPVGFSVNWIAPRLAHYLEQANGPPFRIISTVWNEDFDKGRFDLDIRYGTGNWARPISRAIANIQIKASLIKIFIPNGRNNPKRRPIGLFQIMRQPWRNPIDRKPNRRPQGQQFPAAISKHLLGARPQTLKTVLHLGQIRRAHLGENQTAGLALKKRLAQKLFQQFNLFGNCSLRQKQFLSGMRKTQMPRCGFKGAQPAE